jgi:hypothetical protein
MDTRALTPKKTQKEREQSLFNETVSGSHYMKPDHRVIHK